MAKKGQQFKTYNPDIKISSVKEYLSCSNTITGICEKYNITSFETLLSWIRKYKKYGIEAFKERRGKATKADSPLKGRPRTRFSSALEKQIYLNNRENIKKQSAEELEKKKRRRDKID